MTVKNTVLLHLAGIYFYEIINIYVEIILILGLYVNKTIIFNLCSDYTLYFAKYEIDLSAILHPGISRFHPTTGPGRPGVATSLPGGLQPQSK